MDPKLPGFDVEAVWDGACRILERIGMEVPGDRIRQTVSKALPVKSGRAFFPRDVVEHHAAEIRKAGTGGSEAAPRAGRVAISNNPFCTHFFDADTGRARPYDTQTLIRHTRLACSLRESGFVLGQVTGAPQDVPARLRFLASYFVNCCYNSAPGPHPLVTDKQVLEYMLAMAAVMGHTQFIGVEPISPLRFAGSSVDLAVEASADGLVCGVDPMPIMGVTAPLDWHAAWAQSVAENLGGYILLRACGCERVSPPSFRLFLPNMASAMIYFSSPQHVLALLSRRKVREFFNLSTDWGELMLVTSKAPDQQAAAEKTAGCVLAKVFGFYFVEGAGNLSMDEIFSPQQLLIDADICRFVNGMEANFENRRQDILAMVSDGIKRGSYLAADHTLQRFTDFIWRPQLFDLRRVTGGGRGILEKAAERAEEHMAAYTYELTGRKREEVERIMAEARRELRA